jgi:hypothetical protein
MSNYATNGAHFLNKTTGRWFELDTRNPGNPDLLTGFAGHRSQRFACVVDVPAADLLAWVNGDMDFLPTGA